MECLQLRSPPGPFHYLISEQAKSLVALQELQNEVGALLEFRDLVIETFPNLRSKMAPSTPASGARRDWEPGVRVRRKLAGAGGDARGKPQPSVQDSGFSTETSCGKDGSAASRSRPPEDELWALLDVIQRKGLRLRDDAEQLRAELDERRSTETAEESFARAMDAGCDREDLRRLRGERDALLARAAALEAAAATPACAGPASPARSPLGRLDRALTPARAPRVDTPDSTKFAAILRESNPVELQRQLLTSTVQNQVLCERLRRAAAHRTELLERLERARDVNDDLKFRLEEKNIELEGARARVRQLEVGRGAGERDRDRDSMRELEPLALPDDEAISETPRRRPSRIPLHTAHKGAAPRPPAPRGPPGPPGAPPRPPSGASLRSRASAGGPASRKEPKSGVPVRRAAQAHDSKRDRGDVVEWGESVGVGVSVGVGEALAGEYVARTERLAHFPRLQAVRARPLPADMLLAYESPQNLALELSKSILYETANSIDAKNLKSLDPGGDDSLWNGKPQHYFESMRYAQTEHVDAAKEYVDSLAP